MIRKLKTLVPAFLACIAGSAALAAGAQAVEFHSGSSHTILGGSQLTTHSFTAGPGFGAISCNTYSVNATAAAATVTTQSVTGTYSNCKDSFGRTVHITTGSCSYKFHASAKKEADLYSATAAVECPSGKGIELMITSGGVTACTVLIPPQTGIGPLELKNETGAPKKIKGIAKATNVKNTTSGGFFNCGIANGEHTEGTYTGDVLVEGTSTAGSAVDVWVE